MVEFPCGAKSSEARPRYDQIPTCALRRLAERFARGDVKFGTDESLSIGGQQQWQGGDAEYFRDRFNHVIDHLLHFKEAMERGQESTDDDLAAAMWGCAVLIWAQENHKL